MLLVEPPTEQQLRKVLQGLIEGVYDREAVVSWQKGVVAQCGWDIPLEHHRGYWYFYSLAFADLPFPDDYFLRQRDFLEYLADMNEEPGGQVGQGIMQLRTHQVEHEEVRWPLAVITDQRDIMMSLPGSRGTFEHRMDLVEHCHLEFEADGYLVVKQYDEQAGQVLLLGSNRDKEKAEQLLKLLGVRDYIFP